MNNTAIKVPKEKKLLAHPSLPIWEEEKAKTNAKAQIARIP